MKAPKKEPAKQLLHLVIGGELENIEGITFKDLSKVDELDMWGITMTTSILGTSLADPSFDPVYAELDKRGAVLFLHPAGLACGSQELVDTGLTWPLGAPCRPRGCRTDTRA